MSGGVGGRSKPFLLLLVVATISSQFASVLGGDPSPTKDAKKDDSHSKSNTGREVLFICLGVGVAIALSIFLFKLWQKKKREEQHARLLKLFEEDDELEVELGLRD
uniref:Transmembrane protein n=1 Tax=Ananas comosus var. bracteatus TaxID=296719 RepID=A0A6V7NI12_ANACO|nr:unnamed protein product [Ananas comosus var. bracteatus]